MKTKRVRQCDLILFAFTLFHLSMCILCQHCTTLLPYAGAHASPLSPRDQLHRQRHQGPPGFWLRRWEGGPPQVCGHQDSTVGAWFFSNRMWFSRHTCLMGSNVLFLNMFPFCLTFFFAAVPLLPSRLSLLSLTCVTSSPSSMTSSSGKRWRKRPRRTNSVSRRFTR